MDTGRWIREEEGQRGRGRRGRGREEAEEEGQRGRGRRGRGREEAEEERRKEWQRPGKQNVRGDGSGECTATHPLKHLTSHSHPCTLTHSTH